MTIAIILVVVGIILISVPLAIVALRSDDIWLEDLLLCVVIALAVGLVLMPVISAIPTMLGR